VRGQSRRRRIGVIAAILFGVTVLTAALVSAASAGPNATSKKGGTYRVGWEGSFGWTDSFDPTGEYLANAFEIDQNLLLRGLTTYKHASGAAGTVPIPDLATAIPKPTKGGTEWKFKMKSGIKFGPPVNREITSRDIRYAIERMARPANGAQYLGYMKVIKGLDAYSKGQAQTISGIKTPNSKTIIFDLTAPTGDFANRLTFPAAAAMPQEVAKCFEGKPGAYGRYVISSGPYMIQGSQNLDISSCDAMKPISGYDGQTSLTLVRNPNYNPKTDSTVSRENNPNSFTFTVDTNIDDIYARVGAGELDDEYTTGDPKVFRQYLTDPSKKKYIHSNSADGTYYVTMNLTQPPFDDVHVRKAMDWIVNRNAMRKAWGGPVAGQIAQHTIPNSLVAGLENYAPFKTPGDQGSLPKALAEMKQSKYKTKGGVCTASQCKNVLLISDTRAVDKLLLPALQASAAKIGITFAVRTVTGAYPVIQTTSNNIPISTRPRWFKDYADPSTFIGPLFYSGNIIPEGNTNYSLVGLKPSQVSALGIKGNTKNIPSIDKLSDECTPTTGNVRLQCYGKIDKVLTEQIVPWVPYMWANTVTILGPKVAKWNFDQAAGFTALAHVAVK
jgi:peptide/nickel transport system substrate-binding protein